MVDPIEINRRNWDERAGIHARDITGDYMLDRFRAGEDALHAIEAAELGDVSGKRVLHLQCHIGRDTLCLVRRGAIATGLDFSGVALNIARRLADETGLWADFVQGTVEEAPSKTPGPFNLVFTTWGTICWLADVRVWARAIAAVLRPGGELYFADAHPGFVVLEERAGVLTPVYDFQTPADRPLEFVNATTYMGDPTALTSQATREWIHSLSAIFGALIEAGLTIVTFSEHEVLPWQGLPILVPASNNRLWRLPDGHPRIPLSFSLRARKTSK
jgi:2-polyprenyl-3-methyl-5-hydroxy-6-metoxy-1,4-benzoquinol methylase